MTESLNKYLLALDEGTTNAKATVFNKESSILSSSHFEISLKYPISGWVEQNAEEIWESQLKAIKESLKKAKIEPSRIAALGITNQRETTILWEKSTGKPVYNAIVWQCRRTADTVEELRKLYESLFKEKTGLIPDSYFSGPKIKWVLDNVPNLKDKAIAGELMFGTVDSFLIWKLTNGEKHVIDYSNASRTMMFNIHKMDWDEELLEILDIPENILPEPKPSSQIYGYTDPNVFGASVPIASDIGDQQAALFGQAAFEEGITKCTYGTGNFLLMNTGTKPKNSKRLLTTVAWGINNRVTYALEGSIYATGAAIQWLRDSLGIIKDASETEALASSVKTSEGVYFVPAFVGLGAPYWDQYARGLIIGLTRGSNKPHLIRAVLESITYLTRDVIEALEKDSNMKVKELRVDGGASKNNFLMQNQADISDIKIVRPVNLETTSLGAAYLAGLSVDYWSDLSELVSMRKTERVFKPKMDEKRRNRLYKAWKAAVEKSLGWARILKRLD